LQSALLHNHHKQVGCHGIPELICDVVLTGSTKCLDLPTFGEQVEEQVDPLTRLIPCDNRSRRASYCFNGAAAFQPRKLPASTSVRQPPTSLQWAAAFQPRKFYHHLCLIRRANASLQWDRSLSAAEICPSRNLIADPGVVSETRAVATVSQIATYSLMPVCVRQCRPCGV
jgi:hypothetical protein